MEEKPTPNRRGQPPVEHPRRRKINVLLTDAEADRLDQLRGAVPAGTWIRLQIGPVLRGGLPELGPIVSCKT